MIFALTWLSLPVEASTPKHSARIKPVSRKTQIPVSFLPAKRPISALEHLKTPLVSRVVVKQEAPPPAVNPIPVTPAPLPPGPSVATTNPLTATLSSPVKTKTLQARPGFTRKVSAIFNALRPTRRPPVSPKTSSWATRLTPEEARQIAGSIRQFLTADYPPATTTLILLPLAATRMNHPLPSALDDTLRQAGFALANTKAQAPHAQVVRYRVCAVEGGLFVTLKINDRQASRYYLRTSANGLLSISPYTVGR